jgi:hypothetical protein
VPEGRLVWAVFEAVGGLDVSVLCAEYGADGHGRGASGPSMMVALLLSAYARGIRSAWGIERAGVGVVALRVVAGDLVPGHSRVVEFCRRHGRAFGERCARALRSGGVVSVGVVAIDGMKMSANAAIDSNRDCGQIARAILEQGAEIDRRQDELYGSGRGGELPEQLRTGEGRREAFRDANERLEREREADQPVEDGDADAAWRSSWIARRS